MVYSFSRKKSCLYNRGGDNNDNYYIRINGKINERKDGKINMLSFFFRKYFTFYNEVNNLINGGNYYGKD